ncbi:uncharacterized protein [Penaeus vannamei]|uniref:uncharacterized protein n=1 Tax=Penaeus vannamei TaxID=6689 RepID=UPI00387F6375
MEQFIRNLREEVEGHFLVNDFRPAYQTLRKLNSKPNSQEIAVCSCWAEYFEQLYQVDPPTVILDVGSAEIPLPDPPISKDSPSLTEVKRAISKLRSGKAAGICGIKAELLMAGGELIAWGMHAVLAAIWQSGIIPPYLLRERRRDFGSGLLEVYLDLKKAFDTVHWESLWEILRLRGIPTKIRLLAKASFFNTCMDWILGRATVQSHWGYSLGNIKVSDLDFADVSILFGSLEILVVALDAFSNDEKPLHTLIA